MSKETKKLFTNKSVLFIGLLGLLVLAGCASTNEPVASEPLLPAVQDAGSNPIQTALDAGAPLKEITLNARQFAFEPAAVTVPQGAVVRLTLNSLDVSHGIAIPGVGVDLGVNAGSSATVDFLANKKGEFPFYCSIYCGAGHGGMRGVLVVE